ncbi:MAG: tripartite tricarboxylate transporter substrate binding protein [Betaproteobacteria bacterium]|nr:tripartite tricarboxylate transporter substrate binding protein [Betaproteobacteria bacterium]
MTATIAAVVAAATAVTTAHAQGWPQRPVKIVVPYAPGSSPDVLVRIVQEKLALRLAQPVVVENRAGAGGNIGTDFVAKSAADGYTFLVSTNGPLVYNTVMYRKLPYDPFADLAPVTLAGAQPNVCAVINSLNVGDVKEWVAALKKNPGKYNFSSTGVGSMSHLSIELIKARTSTYAVHIPYASSPLAITAMLQGDVHMACVPPVAVMPQAKAGRIRAIAVTSSERSALVPELPTMKESGFPEIEAMAWMAIMAPARTPQDIIARMNRELVAVLRDPDTRQKMAAQYMEPIGGTPEELTKFMREELARWTPVIKRSGATVD